LDDSALHQIRVAHHANLDDPGFAFGRDSQEVGQFHRDGILVEQSAAVTCATSRAAKTEFTLGKLQGHAAFADAFRPREQEGTF
jgi:hypothetical protein